MEKDARVAIIVNMKAHADFERYHAILSAERGQTQDDAVKALLKKIE